MTDVTLIGETTMTLAAEARADRCVCCGHDEDVRRDIEAWWEPTPGKGYGPDGRLISLCEGCIVTLKFFVETPYAR